MAAAQQATISKWDPYSVLGDPKKHPSIVVCAARNSGKTVTVRSIFEPLLDLEAEDGGYDAVFVCSRSAPTLEAYTEWIPVESPSGKARPDPFVDIRERPGFLSALLRTLAKTHHIPLLHCTESANNSSAGGNPQQVAKRLRRTLVILDDILEIGQTRYNKELSSLYTEGRHYGITVVTITQSLSELSTATRKNTTVFLCGQLTSGTEVKAVCDQYLSFCIEPNPEEWPNLPTVGPALEQKKPTKQKEYLLALFRACTTLRRYGFLVVDFDKPALFTEAIAWYKAEL